MKNIISLTLTGFECSFVLTAFKFQTNNTSYILGGNYEQYNQ